MEHPVKAMRFPHRRTFLSKIISSRKIPCSGMPVTKHKAASCRKFNVVAPRGRDKRGESFSRLSTVANFVARLARKSSLRDCKRKIQVDSAGVGKSAAG